MAPPSNSAAKRRRRKTLDCFISKLSEKLLSEIFLNLPIATLMCCRRVCRSWRSILFSPAFNQLRLDRCPNSDVVICRSGKKFFFYERKELALAAVSVVGKGSSLSTRCSVLHLVNSCNGLICMVRCLGFGRNPCSLRNRSRSCYGSTIFVVNPVTSEYVALPSTPEGLNMEMCALGFCNKTNEFKAFRILSKTFNPRRFSIPKWLNYSSSGEEYSDHETSEESIKSRDGSDSEGSVKLVGLRLGVEYEDKSYVVEVCTLRAGTWRRIEVDLKSLRKVFLHYEESYSFTYVNGSVYWIGEWNDHPDVVSFNFETERFKGTGGGFYSDALGIGAFRGDSLYFCRLEDIDFDAIHRANRGSEVFCDDDDLNEGDRGVEVYLYKGSWAEEAATVVKIPKDLMMPAYGYPVVKYFENGNILFWEPMGLFLFDKEKQEWDSVEGFSSCEMRSREDVIVHVPTFLSLKAMLEGGSLQVRNVGSKHVKA